MKRIQSGLKKTLLFFILTVVSSIAVLFLYNKNLETRLDHTVYKTLSELAEQQRFNLYQRLTNDINFIKSLSITIKFLPKDDEAVHWLHDVLRNSNFEALIIANTHGTALVYTGEATDISNTEYFTNAMQGITAVNNPNKFEVGTNTTLVISTPIYDEAMQVIGVLVGSYDKAQLNNLILPSFGGKGYAYITDGKGNIITYPAHRHDHIQLTTNGINIFDNFKKLLPIEDKTPQAVTADMAQFKSDYMAYSLDDEVHYLRYVPLGINDWYVFAVTSHQAVASDAASILINSTALAICIVIAVTLCMFFFLWREKKYTHSLERIAYYDKLTQAPNQEQFIANAQRFIDLNPSKKFLMVKFDIDRFKLINQTLGSHIGDTILINIIKALKVNTPGKHECYARIHDDEFLVLHDYETPHQLIEIRDAFHDLFYKLMGSSFTERVRFISGHYYMDLENCRNAAEAIEKANIAHRKAKKLGIEVCQYDEVFIGEALKRKTIENKMHEALQRGEFKVFLQPQYHLTRETVLSAEALVRWIDNTGEMIYPDEFISLFEANGFILKLDMYMFEKVCILLQDWAKAGRDPMRISVNFSRIHLATDCFVEQLCAIADKYHVPHRYLGIELTESAIFDDQKTIFETLTALHKKDFQLLMDDFGTGYSSLGLLKNIPVDIVKLDKSFFNFIDNQERSKAVLSNIIRMVHDLKIKTVAEGVETEDVVSTLKSFQCDIVQGYYYARPVPAEKFWDCIRHFM